MKRSVHTEQRIAQMLERMRGVMPEVRRQIEVYEKQLLTQGKVKTQKTSVQSRNV